MKFSILAFKLSCHAIQRFTTIIDARYALQFQEASGGEDAGRVTVEGGGMGVRASRSMASVPSGPQ
eukprot:1156662-Pelagomonas_calceolata.AAC.28